MVSLIDKSYSISNTHVYAHQNYSFLHSPDMSPAELVEALIAKSKKPLTQVAEEMGGRSFQGTLYKFVYLGTKSPRHETAQRIARYFDLPLEALFDRAVSTRIASELGLSVSKGDATVASAPTPIQQGKKSNQRRRLPEAMLQRIGELSPKQFRALEHLVETYLDTVSPSKQSLTKQA